VADASAASARRGPTLRVTWAIAGALLALLLGVALAFELGEDREVLVDGPLALPPLPASHMARDDDEPIEDAVQTTPELALDGPTTLEIAISRSGSDAWLGVDVAVIELETLEVRELSLGIERESVGTRLEDARATALVDRLDAGRYVIRLAPRWEPVALPLAGRADTDPASFTPPRAHLRVTSGARSHGALFLAAALILVPPLYASGRRLLARR
jgi:hypothetical protein